MRCVMLFAALALILAGCSDEPRRKRISPFEEKPAAGPLPVTLTDVNFDRLVIKSKKPVLVDFSATWCGPCKQMAPVLDDLTVEFEGKAVVGTVDVDDNPRLSSKYNVTGIPCLLVIHEGKEVGRFVGYTPRGTLARKLNEYVN